MVLCFWNTPWTLNNCPRPSRQQVEPTGLLPSEKRSPYLKQAIYEQAVCELHLWEPELLRSGVSGSECSSGGTQRLCRQEGREEARWVMGRAAQSSSNSLQHGSSAGSGRGSTESRKWGQKPWLKVQSEGQWKTLGSFRPGDICVPKRLLWLCCGRCGGGERAWGENIRGISVHCWPESASSAEAQGISPK